MQDVDRPAQIQMLPEPARARRPRVEAESQRLVLSPQALNWIRGQRDRRRDLGQGPAVGAPEPERTVGLSINLVTLLVDGAMVLAAEQSEVRECGRAALGPMVQVMPLADPDATAREAAALVPVQERAPQRRGNRPGPGANFHDAPVLVVPHHDPARITRQAPRRFCRNARPVPEDGLAGLLRVGQHGFVDVDHHLVPLARRARIEFVVQGRLREQGQRIRLLLGHGRGLRGCVNRGRAPLLTSRSLVQRLAGRGQGPQK